MDKSIKYDNFIYMTICELTLGLFKNSKCVTYANYCKLLNLSIEEDNLSFEEKLGLISVIDNMQLIFSMDTKDCESYIKKFFAEEKYKKFEYPVRYLLEFYPTSILI